MKITVDEMPNEPRECPYSNGDMTLSCYVCTYNQCNRKCVSVQDCPWFTVLTNQIK